MKNSIFKELQVTQITATPKPGAILSKCLEEACQIAMTNQCWIRFKHNGISYVVDDEGNAAKDHSHIQS